MLLKRCEQDITDPCGAGPKPTYILGSFPGPVKKIAKMRDVMHEAVMWDERVDDGVAGEQDMSGKRCESSAWVRYRYPSVGIYDGFVPWSEWRRDTRNYCLNKGPPNFLGTAASKIIAAVNAKMTINVNYLLDLPKRVHRHLAVGSSNIGFP
jgi:hypothetical protein